MLRVHQPIRGKLHVRKDWDCWFCKREIWSNEECYRFGRNHVKSLKKACVRGNAVKTVCRDCIDKMYVDGAVEVMV